MRIIALQLNEIKFENRSYPPELKESVLRRGLAFPIKVNQTVNGYICQDGNKRLTILKELQHIDSFHRYVIKIPVIVVNSDLNRSNDCWRNINMH